MIIFNFFKFIYFCLGDHTGWHDWDLQNVLTMHHRNTYVIWLVCIEWYLRVVFSIIIVIISIMKQEIFKSEYCKYVPDNLQGWS